MYVTVYMFIHLHILLTFVVLSLQLVLDQAVYTPRLQQIGQTDIFIHILYPTGCSDKSLVVHLSCWLDIQPIWYHQVVENMLETIDNIFSKDASNLTI